VALAPLQDIEKIGRLPGIKRLLNEKKARSHGNNAKRDLDYKTNKKIGKEGRRGLTLPEGSAHLKKREVKKGKRTLKRAKDKQRSCGGQGRFMRHARIGGA